MFDWVLNICEHYHKHALEIVSQFPLKCTNIEDHLPILVQCHISIPLKMSEYHRFSDVFRRYRNVALDLNGLICSYFFWNSQFFWPWLTARNWIEYRSSRPKVFSWKVCSKNMQQIYRTTMPQCDFNKVALQFYWNHTSAWVFSFKFAACFQNTFS